MGHFWVTEGELRREFGGRISSVRNSEIYLDVTSPSNKGGIVAVGGEIIYDPKDVVKWVLDAYFDIGSLDNLALRFCEAYDKDRNKIRKIPISVTEAIPLDYVISFVPTPARQSNKEQDEKIFRALEKRVSTLNKWVLFYIITSSRSDPNRVGFKPTRYRQTIINPY